MEHEQQWLTIREAAQALGVPYRTLARWVALGRVRSHWFGDVRAIPTVEVERLKVEGRPRQGLPKGTKLTRRYHGTCAACGTTFQAARPAKYCSPRCSARIRARERAARRRARAHHTA